MCVGVHALFYHQTGATVPLSPGSLFSIQFLSVDNNQLRELPVEFCALTTLQEFHAAGNQLISLPLEFGYLTNLKSLHLQKNKIRELPEVYFGYLILNIYVFVGWG